MNTTVFASNGRGCGFRDENAVYMCCGVGNDGYPIEHFILDPARRWPGEFQRGYLILPRVLGIATLQEVNDLVIFVGKEYYKATWDFVEEVRRYGASRKVPRNLPFEKLTPGQSRMVFVHSRAIPLTHYCCDRSVPLDWCSYSADRETWMTVWDQAGWHPDNHPCTFALQDLALYLHKEAAALVEDKVFTIQMPSFTYDVRRMLNWDTPVRWDVGVFMWLPLTHIEAKNRLDDDVKKKVVTAGYDVEILPY